MAQEISGTTNHTAFHPPAENILWARAGEILSIITAGITVAGSLYGLGLFILWIQFLATYNHDPSTAWYAAALMPKTTVMHHVAAFAASHSLSLLALSVFMFKFDDRLERVITTRARIAFPYSARHLAITTNWRQYFSKPTVQSKVPTGIIGFTTLFIFLAFIAMHKAPGVPIEVSVWSSLFSLTMLLGAGIIWLRLLSRSTSRWKRLLVVNITIAIGFIPWLILFQQTRPSLPYVHFAQPDDPPTSIQHNRKLLAHTGGYWHILIESSGELQAIPDDEAGVVTILPSPR